MAANTGDLISKTFLIPQYQDQPQGRVGSLGKAPEAFDDGVKALDGLQTVQNQTSDYYRKVAALKSFMQDAHNNLGIDVRVPDYAKGEMSIKLNELYNKAIADIMAQGNLLKNSHGRAENLVNQHARFITNPNSKPAEQMEYGKDYTLESASPFVKERNDQIKALYDSGDYAGAQEKYKEVSEYLDRRAKENPETARLFELDKLALEPPRKGVFRPNATREAYQERLWNKKVAASGKWLDDIVFLSSGARDSYTPDTSQLTESGNPMLVSKEFANWKMGPDKDQEIKQWTMNPDTDEIIIKLKNGQTINAGQDTGTVMRTLVAFNGDKMGGLDAAHLEEYLDKNNLQDEKSQVNKTAVLSRRNKYYQKSIDANKAAAAKVGEEVTKQAKSAMENDLFQMKKPIDWVPDIFGGGGSEQEVGQYKIKREKDGYVIENLRDVHPVDRFKNDKDAKAFYQSNTKFPDYESLEKFLIKNNAHIKHLSTKNQLGEAPKAPTTLAPGSLD